MDESPGSPGPRLPPSRFGAGYTVGDGVGEPVPTYDYPMYYPPPASEPPAAVHYPAPEPPAPAHYPPAPTQYPAMVMPVGYVPVVKTNGMAIAALVCALVLAPLGIVFGHIALSQIKRTGEDGRGLAIAGLVIGYIFTGIVVLYFVVVLIFIGWLSSVVNDSNYYDGTYYSMATIVIGLGLSR